MNAVPGEQPSSDSSAAADLIVTLLTPPGRGAVASLEITGAAAASVIGEHLEPLRKPAATDLSTAGHHASFPIDRIVVGYWRSPVGQEQVVVARRADDRFAVHCHGGSAAVEAIVESLARAGACRDDWRRRIAVRATDSLTAAARLLLAEAPTLRTANILLDQYQGALSRAIADLRASIAMDDIEHAVEQLNALLQTARVGQHLVEPWRVVLAGPPNAGKSSLCNALVGYERSIIAPLPGTTRDVLTSRTAVAGWPVELADTAGLADSRDPLDQAGVALAREQLNRADLVLWLAPCDQVRNATIRLPASVASRALVVQSKCDLVVRVDPAMIATSARTGAGIQELLKVIAQRLVPATPPPGAPMIFTREQHGTCQQALAALARGRPAEAQAALAAICQQSPPRSASKNHA